MSETQETADNNHGDQAVISPASPVESSLLSTPPHVPLFGSGEAHEDAATDGDYDPVQNHATSAEDSAQEEPVPSFDCPGCDKTYSTVKSLKRHTTDKKTLCFRTREANKAVTRWVCPRCNAQMSKKHSVARHIKDTCWKTCDECCENDRIECNAHHREDNCNSCEQIGVSCIKHTEAVADCVPELLTAAPAKPGGVPRKTIPIARKQTEKRKAIETPDVSPMAKPKGKSVRVKDSESVYKRELEDQVEVKMNRSDHDSKAADLVTTPPPRTRTLPALAPRYQSRYTGPLPQRERTSTPSGPGVYHDIEAGHRSSRMPPPPGHASFHNSPAALYAHGMPEMLRRQVLAMQGMPPYTPEYGAGMRPMYPAPVMSGTRSSLGLGHNDIRTVSRPYRDGYSGGGGGGARSQHPGYLHSYQDRLPNHLSSARRDMTPQDAPRSDSYVPRPGSITNVQLRSQMSSGQPSRQSSADDLRSSRNSNTADQTGLENYPNHDTKNNNEDTNRLMIKLPMSRELKQQLSTTLHPRLAHPQNPLIRLRIHSNTFDPSGSPIFSILSMRIYDMFGPRLHYYSHTRGQKFGVDWKFIYSYPAPTNQQPERKKYFDLTWTMKPAGCRDRQYPGAAMRDGDTIYVVSRRLGTKPAAEDDSWVEDSIQLQADVIDFQPGETVYQNHAVNTAWWADADRALSAAREEVGRLQNELHKAVEMLESAKDMIRGEEMKNEKLKEELGRRE